MPRDFEKGKSLQRSEAFVGPCAEKVSHSNFPVTPIVAPPMIGATHAVDVAAACGESGQKNQAVSALAASALAVIIIPVAMLSF